MEYKPNKPLPDLTILSPLEKIKELCAVISISSDKTTLHNSINLLLISIRDYEKERFGEKELPF